VRLEAEQCAESSRQAYGWGIQLGGAAGHRYHADLHEKIMMPALMISRRPIAGTLRLIFKEYPIAYSTWPKSRIDD